MFHTEFDEKKKIWSGLEVPCLYDSKVSVGQVILNAMFVNSSKIAQVSSSD